MSTRFTVIKDRAPAFACPCCGAKGTTRTSERLNPTITRLYYRCTDTVCGHAWTAYLEYEASISPSSKGPVMAKLPKQRRLFPSPATSMINSDRGVAIMLPDTA